MCHKKVTLESSEDSQEKPQKPLGILLGWYFLKKTFKSLHDEFAGTLTSKVCVGIKDKVEGHPERVAHFLIPPFVPYFIVNIS
jgi:hypothetical protein